MLIIKKILLFHCFLMLYSGLIAQWEVIHPSTEIHSDLVQIVTPPESNIVYAIGNSFAVSHDNGKHWKPLIDNTLPANAKHSGKVIFTTPSKAFTVYENKILFTTDTGRTWKVNVSLQKYNSTSSSHPNFNSIHFPTPSVGYAVGTFDKILKTTDAGQTWDTLRWNNVTKPFRNYLDVYFFNKDTGYIAGYEVADILMNFGFEPFVMKTTDGGATWDTFTFDSKFDYKVMDLQVIDSKYCFIRCSGSQYQNKIFTSSDSCKTWVDISPDLWNITCMFWIDAQTGFAYGKDVYQNPVFYKTSDKGASWKRITIPPTDYLTDNSIIDIKFINQNEGIAVGEGGNILITGNSGESWSFVNKNFPPFELINYTSNNIAYSKNSLVSALYKTIDGGFSWKKVQATDSLAFVSSICFPDSAKGFIKGYLSDLYKVEEDAERLKQITLPVMFSPYSYTSINTIKDTVYVIGQSYPDSHGIMVKSFDSGLTWNVDTIFESENYINTVIYRNKNWLISTGDKLFLSTDYGKKWNTISTFSTKNSIYSLAIIDSLTLVSCNVSQNKIFRSTNLCASWDTVVVDFSLINDFQVVNDTLVFAYGATNVGEKTIGSIWKSIDAGKTWQEEDLPQKIDNSVTLMTKGRDYVYATGGCGQLFRLKVTEEITPEIITTCKSTNETFKVFPVPASKTLYCLFSGNKITLTGTISNINGSTIKQIQLNQLDTDLFYTDISILEKGIYILTLYDNENYYSQIVIKQ